MTIGQRKASAAWLSVASNSALIVMKVVVGLTIGSVAVISEAIHSGVDLLAAVIALVAVRESGKPADKDHPFGHGKFENISGTVEAVLIFVAAGWIIYEAVGKLLHPHAIEAPVLGVIVMLISSIGNFFVSRRLFKVGKETDSVALKADAWHLRTDVYTSAGVMIGLAMIYFGDMVISALNLPPAQTQVWQDRLHLIDSIAAIAVAMLIIRAAYTLTVQSARDLMDVNLPAEEEEWISDMLGKFRPQVHGFHRMRTRKAGASRFIEFHIFVEPKMTVEESHGLSHDIARRIEDHFGPSSVQVHVEPCRGKCGLPGQH